MNVPDWVYLVGGIALGVWIVSATVLIHMNARRVKLQQEALVVLLWKAQQHGWDTMREYNKVKYPWIEQG